MIVFYHNDLDGNCAAAIWYRSYPKSTFIEMSYEKPVPWAAIKEGEPVVILDFSLQKPGEWGRLLAITADVTWIDHHASAIAAAQGKPEEKLAGIRNDTACGALLTWNFLYTNVRVPATVNLVDKWDRWQHNDSPKVLDFVVGMEMEDIAPSSKLWKALFSGGGDAELSRIRERGKLAREYQAHKNAKILKEGGYETTLDGHKILACNAPMVNSKFFDSADLKNIDIVAPYKHYADGFTVSLYSSTVAVNKLAEKFGGGGHPGASGFQCKKLPWSNVEAHESDQVRQKGDSVSPVSHNGAPLWWRDARLLSLAMGGAWKRVSRDYMTELRSAFRDKNPDQVHELLNGKIMTNLGPEMVRRMGRKTRGILLNSQARAQKFWRPKIKAAQTTKAVSDYSGDYQDYIVKSIDRQVNSFLLAHPERILTPEIQRQLEYLKESELTTSADVQNLLDRLETVESQQDYFDRLSDTQISRVWHSQGVMDAEDAGIRRGVISGPDDAKTCYVCRRLIGTEFDISAMAEKIRSDLDLEDLQDYIAAWTFPRKADVDNVSRSDLSQLVETTGGIPAHPGCRHSMEMLSR